MLKSLTWSVAAAMVGLAATSASAQLLYVDADKTTNTAPPTAFTVGANDSADDNLWSLRTGFASGGTIYEAGQGDGEDAPEIITTIGGLIPDTDYTVYVHFWDGSGTAPDWNIRAGFSSGNTTVFANPADAPDIGGTDAVLASELEYAVAPTTFQEADRTSSPVSSARVRPTRSECCRSTSTTCPRRSA